ncbi:putative mitochondrial chaperone protein DNAj [Leptomonas pyrrhocoris]|uniref:Putative mitochondrial chaperone protein DNAj n=1 Tax=Leptomonas pyrrhocoris TaxID=157538 RepID=A0A0M9FRW0_LEPPY|nr:putative mitochondrial chaperone protein DNAj [Leptomonas pyrrhocoris]XP_015653046.1 putative mitochondrial chaperone protein DNAj [Leptomonas pyrrhocoris]KPA74606.1 putative mitochondrial chaperone protein DNAj [Leptomonas pyrrhocoris]KPA74607.1 putative mitochondrial chaperone protein DNAj [Leptomonas pyrrhocoris]|eukprot:XP_015653045.1 putative mitochondrial chaperone protein DNAj [Leptomonas pyrrhocoris]
MLRFSRRMLVSAGSGPFDPYKILGVKADASKDEIKKAYHRLALRFHPDSGAEGSAERFAAVNEAYEAVKDGKWRPSAERQQKSAADGGSGWNPKMRMYVYEQPGSTTEGYVSGDTEKYLRMFMVGCFLFVFIRFSLFFLLPGKKREEVPLESPGTDGVGGSADGTLASFDGLSSSASPFPPLPGGATKDSVHRDDEADFKWNYDAQRAPMQDPLSHRQ